jgi:hypothetical protein
MNINGYPVVCTDQKPFSDGTPDVIFANPATPEQIEALRKEWNKIHSGAAQWNQPRILEDRFEIRPMTFLERIKWTWKRVDMAILRWRLKRHMRGYFRNHR